MGGVGIVRISGPAVQAISKSVVGRLPKPRYATHCRFRGDADEILDEGLALFFPAPCSFTGEDVLELQGHGGPVVLDRILRRVLSLGARTARPGEFSERAFLNGKLDLAQAEAIADLIESTTEAAARLATRTLQGDFSRLVHALRDGLTELRAYVEGAVDFPEEEIDFLAESDVRRRLAQTRKILDNIMESAHQGCLLRDGITIVIAGRPNAGKSSLLNALTRREAAIVTAIPGTTRDVLRERIQIDGMPVHVVDTAGLRLVDDEVEQEGVRRARAEIQRADRVLWLFDAREPPFVDKAERESLPGHLPVILIRNKIDLTGASPGLQQTPDGTEIAISIKTAAGVDALLQHLKESAGYQGEQEGEFLARRRHLDALERSRAHLEAADSLLCGGGGAELVAEELRLSQNTLAEITGEFLAEDLLGEIFSRFCIGK